MTKQEVYQLAKERIEAYNEGIVEFGYSRYEITRFAATFFRALCSTGVVTPVQRTWARNFVIKSLYPDYFYKDYHVYQYFIHHSY